MTGGAYKALAGRIGLLVHDVQRVVQRIEFLHDKAQQTGDSGFLDGVALNLHSFYTGVEAIFEDIGRTVDNALPNGGNWHQELLQQMAAQLEDLRPAVISQETRACLDEYRAFRHLVRNLYTFNLRPSRVGELAVSVQECFGLTSSDLEEFVLFLKAAE